MLCEVIGRQYGRSASLATVDDAKTQQFLTDLMIKISKNKNETYILQA